MMLRILLSVLLTLSPVVSVSPTVEEAYTPVEIGPTGSPIEILGTSGPVCDTTSMATGATTFTTATSGSVLASPGAGLRNYVYSGQVVNTGNTNVLITWRDGAAGSALGYTSAPAGYGRSSPVYVTPFRTTAATALYAQTDAASTTVYVSVQGCKLP